ncbi:type 1 glutamine amidotransferase [Neolewinella persica]|uniref:type 1 glutamine amidotransferase n=1 Tax=Neolewinella persica TaxID=70998 RepID=UPI00039B0A0B|nr:GMP synthase [Neolewinella persica]
MSRLRLAILDLYNGIPNQGMRCIRELVEQFADRVDYDVFDVRVDGKVPSLEYDIFISSGGPGDPREVDGDWYGTWTDWLDSIMSHNATNDRKKFVFFICHSFQMAVHHFQLAEVTERMSISFGTFPIHQTKAGKKDPIFKGLESPFTAADFRHFQAIQPDKKQLEAVGATLLAKEKIRPHVDLERALMGVRWSPEVVGVQFHPEADPEGMLAHFSRPDIKMEVIADHGRDKWLQMIEDLSHPDRIQHTHDTIVPGFLRRAIEALTPQKELAANDKK